MSSEKPLTDKDFFFAYLDDYLDDSPMSIEDKTRFAALYKNKEWSDKAELYKNKRGQLQLVLEKSLLEEQDLRRLRMKVQDERHLIEAEEKNIQKLSQRESQKQFFFQFVVGFCVFTLLSFIVYRQYTKPESFVFNPLQSLAYESLMLEDDEQRLDFPSRNKDDIAQFFMNADLGFKTHLLQLEDWTLGGGAVMDYEKVKISAVQWQKNAEDKFFHYTLAGSLALLPPSVKNTEGDLLYQAYASDDLNMIAWQEKNDVLCIVAGRKTPETLAKLVNQGRKR